MDFTFIPDEELEDTAHRYADDAVQNAARLGVTLDFTPGSVHAAEEAMLQVQARAEQGEEARTIIARQFGSYVGEVLLMQAAGEWGVTELASGEKVAAIYFPARDLTLWPWAKAHQRLTEQTGDDLQTYVETVLATVPKAGPSD